MGATNWSGALRKDIGQRSESYATARGLPRYHSLGTPPTVMFEPFGTPMCHGNFLDSSYAAIAADPAWRIRLTKPHQRRNALPPIKQAHAMELDSSNSSDALLMNVFCHSAVASSAKMARLFGLQSLGRVEFGVAAQVLFATGRTDRTEQDIGFGDVVAEGKLTEADFTCKPKTHVASYRDFAAVFDTAALREEGEQFRHYQLIRNVLAIHASGKRFFLICDGRRPDLLRAWWEVVRCVQDRGLRSRCHFLFWQEIAAEAPRELGDFLLEKYGIRAGS